MGALPAASGAPPSSAAAPRSTSAGALRETGKREAGPGEAGLGEAGGGRLWRRAGWGAVGGNGGGTVGARRLLLTRRRGRARGVAGLPEPGGGGGAGGEPRVLETWGGGMVGLAGAGRLAVEEGEGWLGVHTACGKSPSSTPPWDLRIGCICRSLCREQFPRWLLTIRASVHVCPQLEGPSPALPQSLAYFPVVFSSRDSLPSEMISSVLILLDYCLSP